MARSQIPDALARRHLLERELPAAQALRIAEACLAQERRLEALDFLRVAGASDALDALRALALEQGDAFLLRSVAAASGRPPERDEWLRLGEAATAQGKQRYAAEARRTAGVGAEP